jgi:hypothetical protein
VQAVDIINRNNGPYKDLNELLAAQQASDYVKGRVQG